MLSLYSPIVLDPPKNRLFSSYVHGLTAILPFVPFTPFFLYFFILSDLPSVRYHGSRLYACHYINLC